MGTLYSSTPDASPATGQIWIDTDTNALYTYNGSAWVTTRNPYILDSDDIAPVSNVTDSGACYWDFAFTPTVACDIHARASLQGFGTMDGNLRRMEVVWTSVTDSNAALAPGVFYTQDTYEVANGGDYTAYWNNLAAGTAKTFRLSVYPQTGGLTWSFLGGFMEIIGYPIAP